MADDFATTLKAAERRVAAEETAKVEAEIARQKAERRLNIIPMPQVATQPFRSELTVERHALFVSNGFKGEFWKYERTVTHPESEEPVIQRVTVGKVANGRSLGVLTQAHQEIFYGLLKLWAETGYPLSSHGQGVIETTAYELVTKLRGSDAPKHYARVRSLLRELHSIPITLENAYTWQGVGDLEEFTLLGEVHWQLRKIDPATHRPLVGGKSQVRILLSSVLTEGFLRKNIKQLLYGPYQELGAGKYGRRAEVARLLYPLLDHELATKETYHVRLAALAERLGMAPKAYRSKRHEQFIGAVRALNGKPILSEQFRLSVELRESEDADDYVLVARKDANQLGLFKSDK
jgi:hypothetical protein